MSVNSIAGLYRIIKDQTCDDFFFKHFGLEFYRVKLVFNAFANRIIVGGADLTLKLAEADNGAPIVFFRTSRQGISHPSGSPIYLLPGDVVGVITLIYTIRHVYLESGAMNRNRCRKQLAVVYDILSKAGSRMAVHYDCVAEYERLTHRANF